MQACASTPSLNDLSHPFLSTWSLSCKTTHIAKQDSQLFCSPLYSRMHSSLLGVASRGFPRTNSNTVPVARPSMEDQRNNRETPRDEPSSRPQSKDFQGVRGFWVLLWCLSSLVHMVFDDSLDVFVPPTPPIPPDSTERVGARR